jgi:hypothetical protein
MSAARNMETGPREIVSSAKEQARIDRLIAIGNAQDVAGPAA